jgi:flagellar motor component MotA
LLRCYREWHFFSDSRLVAASDGAVISGWLGSFTGAVLIAGNINGNWEALGPAIAVMLLTVLYGYFIKAVIKMILISRNNG